MAGHQPNEYTINCIFGGEGKTLSVGVESNATVEALKVKIKNKASNTLAHIDAYELAVWKLNDPIPISGMRDELSKRGKDVSTFCEEMIDLMDIGEYFKESPPSKQLHVVVYFPDKTPENPIHDLPTLKRPASAEIDDPEQRKRAMKERHDAAIKAGVDGRAPSSAARPTDMVREQKDNPIAHGRPLDMTGPSIFLYHPVFLQFRKMMHEEAQNIPPEFRVEVYQFMNKAAAIYNTENIRRVSVEEPLGSLLGRAIIATQLPDGTSNDGCILTSVSDHLALCLLLEMKNEVGTGGCDPAAQGSYSTRKFWASDKGRYFRSNTCSPTFILAMPGPWLQVQGFVLVDDAVAQPLTDYIWLGGDADIEAQIDKVAKVLFALKRSLESLETYYQYLSPSPDPGNIAYLNPCITSYSTDTESMEFTYNGRMFPRGSRAVFSAQSFSGLNLVVKFTTKYNCDAHRLLANSGLAPKLYYASSCPAVPGYTMVVMERIGMDATVLGWQARTEEMYKTVEQAVHLLHASDYVFGDLRLVNIVVDKGGGVYLVDFDWCGKENVDRYPATLNDTGAIVWAKGVRRGALMRKEHDLEMLDRLKSDFLAT